MGDRRIIKEVIVVEGRDDQVNLLRVVDANFVLTHGYTLSHGTFDRIVHAAKTFGIIVFTDPDFAGNVIRKKVVRAVEAARAKAGDPAAGEWVVKHAYISQEEGTLKGDIGVENASGEALLRALDGAKAEIVVNKQNALYSERDMYSMGLVGGDQSKALRIALGQYLSIGYGNGKQFLQRLNAYQVPYERVAAFLEAYEAEHGTQKGGDPCDLGGEINE